MALTLTTSKEITTKAGAGADSTITSSGAWVVEIGEQAEKDFVAETRWSFLDDFAELNDYTKGLVSTAVSSLAAKRIVKYNSSGYFSSFEQQTILDVLTDDYNRILKLLSQLDHNSIRSVLS